MKMTLGYMAGFLDGEGCVQLVKGMGRYFPRVLLVNTNREILEAFQERFGGDIKTMSRRNPNWKLGYQWRIANDKAVRFLDGLSPYLRIKRRQAHVVFAWAAIAPGSKGRWDQERMEAAELLVRQIHWLNRKGIHNDPEPVEELLMALGL